MSRQKSNPNKVQTGFIGSKHVTVKGQPIEESIEYIRSKCFQSFRKGVQRFVRPSASQASCHLMPVMWRQTSALVILPLYGEFLSTFL